MNKEKNDINMHSRTTLKYSSEDKGMWHHHGSGQWNKSAQFKSPEHKTAKLTKFNFIPTDSEGKTQPLPDVLLIIFKEFGKT